MDVVYTIKSAGNSLYEAQMSFVPAAPSLKALKETPTMRIEREGVTALSMLELVASIVGNADTALQVLNKFPSLPDIARAQMYELANVHGMGQTTAARLKASFEIGRRAAISTPDERLQVRSPADAANLLMGEMQMLEQEHFCSMLLDTRNRVIAVVTVYIGSLNTTAIRIAEVFREAIRRNAAAIIVAHNHPSGDPSPSPEDVAVTRNIIAVGKTLDIDVLDHVVIGHGRFVSLKERGLAFESV